MQATERPTAKQLRYLRVLGFDGKAPDNKRDMMALISFVKKNPA